MSSKYTQAAELIEAADGLFICAGAGMSVDSGIPAFRGANGLWSRSITTNGQTFTFEELAEPDRFRTNPELAWAFYGWRYQSIQSCNAHLGYQLLHQWSRKKKHGAYVLSSNVDGLFHKEGFDDTQICECHGSIQHLQCSDTCNCIWKVETLDLQADLEQLKCRGELPRCPECGSVARPNINMFNDPDWNPLRCNQSKEQMRRWLEPFAADAKLCILEIGAGFNIPPIKIHAQHYAKLCNATIIRINPESDDRYQAHLCLESPALEALSSIELARSS